MDTNQHLRSSELHVVPVNLIEFSFQYKVQVSQNTAYWVTALVIVTCRPVGAPDARCRTSTDHGVGGSFMPLAYGLGGTVPRMYELGDVSPTQRLWIYGARIQRYFCI